MSSSMGRIIRYGKIKAMFQTTNEKLMKFVWTSVKVVPTLTGASLRVFSDAMPRSPSAYVPLW